MIQPNVDVFVDTFADNDRGYFVKNGVVDRRYNPRIGSQVVRNLYAELNQQKSFSAGNSYSQVHGEVHTFNTESGFYALVLPTAAMYLKALDIGLMFAENCTEMRSVNLETGVVSAVNAALSQQTIDLDSSILYQVPTLLSLSSTE
ncbi:MAG: hypothetical protein V7739_14920 [Motiliproteus sp.]